MKIAHISDIHGDIATLRTFKDFVCSRDDLEVIACTGDFFGLNPELSNQEIKKKLKQARQMMSAYDFIRNNTDSKIPFKKVLKYILEHPNQLPDEVRESFPAATRDYQDYERIFVQEAKQQYEQLAEVFKNMSQKKLLIPGNWDSWPWFDHFGDSDLSVHNSSRTINNSTFAGYGESPEHTVFVPPTKVIGFDEDELYKHLTHEDPDIALTHVPPRFTTDQTSDTHLGSFGVLAYIFREKPMMVLCGHNHNNKVQRVNGVESTVVVNSGNLGKYHRQKQYGTFSIIDIDNKNIRAIDSYQIRNKKIEHLREELILKTA